MEYTVPLTRREARRAEREAAERAGQIATPDVVALEEAWQATYEAAQEAARQAARQAAAHEAAQRAAHQDAQQMAELSRTRSAPVPHPIPQPIPQPVPQPATRSDSRSAPRPRSEAIRRAPAEPEDVARSRHRGRLRHRSRSMILLILVTAVGASTWALRSVLSDGPVDPRDLAAHALAATCLSVAVLWHGAQLRAADRASAAALLPWLTVALPLVTDLAWTARDLSMLGLTPNRSELLAMAAHPGWVAAATLLAADGVRSTWTELTRTLAAVTLGGTMVMIAVRPDLAEALRGWQQAPLRTVLAASTVSAALIAASQLPTGSRWPRALGCALPAMALAILPTLLTAPAALQPEQRWTVVIYPLGCLAAASLAVMFAALGELASRAATTT
ncbi:MAG: hypothetical protein IPK24_14815 [Kineosporiaceae bacterium]|nr:hypothetical protein [Kineosporiaceae bacterium]